jgi:Cd2+/Zn2+-exporting ATPase
VPAQAAFSGRPDAAPPGTHAARYRIDQMDCPTEERLIRNRLEPMQGVARLDFNLLARELTVHHRLHETSTMENALVELGMAPVVLEAGQHPVTALPPALPRRMRVLLAVSGIAAVGAEVAASITGQDAGWLVVGLAVLSLLSAGLPTLRKGWIALRHLTLNIYFLMSLALIGALVIGKWSEAAMVVFLFALAEAIEALSLERARKAVESLSALAPDVAHVFVDGEWWAKPVADVDVGSRMRVRTGERVALDARVLHGRAALDQAPITGESLPVDKQPGDVLYAGSIVTDGVIEAEVTTSAGDSTLARIARAIQEAQSQRAPTQRFVDTFARYYTPAVVLLALGVAVLGPWLTGGAWADWLYEALVMLVIACPCALVVSTPVTVVSGLAAAARRGILIKGGRYLEGGRLIKAMALDKTGTLTMGQPSLTDVVVLGTLPQADVLKLAASLDQQSTHPVAKAIVAGWRQRDPHAQASRVDDFKVLPGQGVAGRMEDARWQLRRPDANDEPLHGLLTADMLARVSSLTSQGKTAVLLMREQEVVGLLAVADTVRPQSAKAIAQLRRLGIHVAMLTGDNADAARFVAQQVGIDDVRAGLMPAQKLAAIVSLKDAYGHVGMVGDGINDAPALARADIGLAMGAAGTATALESADVAIMDDDPGKVAAFLTLSRQTSRVLKQNIALALGIKAAFLALALTGQATLWMAVFADMGASLLVVFNGLRLLQSRF